MIGFRRPVIAISASESAMSSKANTFGTFLQTLNSGKDKDPALRTPDTSFDLEASAKRALQFLVERKGNGTLKDLESALALPPELALRVADYLVEASLIARSGDMVELTSFGRSAMNMFSLS
jgi:hypothetical protein